MMQGMHIAGLKITIFKFKSGNDQKYKNKQILIKYYFIIQHTYK